MRRHLYRKHWDWGLTLPTLLLLLIGTATIYSATRGPTDSDSIYFFRHLAFLTVGTGVFLFFLLLPMRVWEDFAYPVFGLALLLLVLVLVLGTASHGSTRWFGFGPVRFQPSEFAKLALVAVLARYLAGKRVDLSRGGPLAISFAFILAPTALVLRQPDLGTAAAFPALALPMLIWAGIPQLVLFVLVSPLIAFFLLHHPILWIGFLVLSVVIFWRSRLSVVLLLLFLLFHIGVHLGAPAAISTLHPYQQARIEAFYHPGADPSGTGYQVLQSRIAIGSGEAFGKGYLQGSQKALSFLPQQHTDFIFSVLGEEWGFAGAALVIVLFGILVLRGIHVAKTCRSPFGSLLLVGLSGLIFYHAAVNVAMTMGLFPVTGLPLPLMSYGGSFLLTMLAGLGQMVNASVHRYEY